MFRHAYVHQTKKNLPSLVVGSLQVTTTLDPSPTALAGVNTPETQQGR